MAVRRTHIAPFLMAALAKAFGMTAPIFHHDAHLADHRRSHRRRKFKGWQRERSLGK